MQILIAGASGFIGRQLTQSLIRAGHGVTACVRSPRRFTDRFPEVRAIQCDFGRDVAAGTWAPRLRDIDVVINAVGIIREDRKRDFESLHVRAPIALFDACARAGVERVVQISALGADAQAAGGFLRTKAEADAHLSRLDLHWTIIRPSLVYGAGSESWALFRALAALPWTPLVERGEQSVQPIHVEDLAQLVGRCLAPGYSGHEVIEAVGPNPLPFRELLDRQRRWLGHGPLRPIGIPGSAARRLAGLGGALGVSSLSPETVEMLSQGSQADPGRITALLGRPPRQIAEALDATPAWQADRWHARLYFLKAPLRWSIGLLWIVTGLLSAGLYPTEESYRLLGVVGLTGNPASLALYGAALLDCVLGAATLARYRLKLVVGSQILLMLGYTLIITADLPELWLHPFGPVTKNLPLLLATLVMLALEDDA